MVEIRVRVEKEVLGLELGLMFMAGIWDRVVVRVGSSYGWN